jgi:hypothetical protein
MSMRWRRRRDGGEEIHNFKDNDNEKQAKRNDQVKY